MNEDMKKIILGCVTILIRRVTFAKFVRCFITVKCKTWWKYGVWLHNAVVFKDNPGKKLTRHDKSGS